MPNSGCGCKIRKIGAGFPGSEYIVYCPLHESARELLEAAKEALRASSRYANPEQVARLRKAIEKASGKGMNGQP